MYFRWCFSDTFHTEFSVLGVGRRLLQRGDWYGFFLFILFFRVRMRSTHAPLYLFLGIFSGTVNNLCSKLNQLS